MAAAASTISPAVGSAITNLRDRTERTCLLDQAQRLDLCVRERRGVLLQHC